MREMNREQFVANGMELVIGEARFVGPRRVEVLEAGGTRVLEGDHAVINLGTRPALPDVPGLVGAGPLTSETLLELERIPERLVVVGGGYVGLEAAPAMRRFGSRVTVLQRGPQLLSREDDDVAAAAAEIPAEDGVEIVLGARLRARRRAPADDGGGDVRGGGRDRRPPVHPRLPGRLPRRRRSPRRRPALDRGSARPLLGVHRPGSSGASASPSARRAAAASTSGSRRCPPASSRAPGRWVRRGGC